MPALETEVVVPLLLLVCLYGVYFVLAVVAIWATWHRSAQMTFGVRLATVLMFIVVTVHTILQLSVSFTSNTSASASLPVVVNVTPCLAVLLSDGIVAWRCWKIWGRHPMVKWLLITAILSGAVVGISAAFTSATSHQRASDNLLTVWDWWYFVVNTCMTGSIAGKIINLCMKRRRSGLQGSRCFTLLRASVESSLISWLALMVYGIWTARTSGHIDLALSNVVPQRAAFTLLPPVFGISQSLIIARLGVSRYARQKAPPSVEPLRFARGDCENGRCSPDSNAKTPTTSIQPSSWASV